MISLKLCRNTLIRLLVVFVIISSLAIPPAQSQESEDSQVFIAGFNAYQQKDYTSAIAKMNEVLQKYPDTPLRDMALFWLSRAHYKSGNQNEAARFLSQFSKEYPDNPLKATVEEELLTLTARYEKGEKLPSGQPAAKQPDRVAAQKARAAQERIAAEQAAKAKADQERIAAEKKEQDRLAALKAEEQR
ncbi:MAG: tetratricopeptide repeat protein, partial [Deltaproteobacteria bacterium]|nr:tetratricopeptide repeat protein [Deltaproteobacteria bacterium]